MLFNPFSSKVRRPKSPRPEMNSPLLSTDQVISLFDQSIDAIEVAKSLAGQIVSASNALVECLRLKRKILICGNGGSAADSLHFSGELLNKYHQPRPSLAAISLAADTSTLTSIGNDESFDQAFSKQVQALGRKGDILVVITTSGNSPSILQAAKQAQELGMTVIALNGRQGGALGLQLDHNDFNIVVPVQTTARIQEVHGIIIHMFCQFIDQQLFDIYENS